MFAVSTMSQQAFFCVLKLYCDIFLSPSLSCCRYCFAVSRVAEINKMWKRVMVNESKTTTITGVIKGEFQFRENTNISLLCS